MSSSAKRSSAIGIAEQFEMDQMAEAEYERLQRQFRLMEKERLIFYEDKNKKSRKNKKIIEILRKERDQLHITLNAIQEGPHAKRESELELKMKNLVKEQESVENLVENEKSNLWEIEGHIKKLQKETDELRGHRITDIKHKETIFKQQKEVTKLENRLDVANKRAGIVMAENAELRLLIDHMLQERAHFNDMWQKMVAQLNHGKKYIMDLIEQSTTAFDQREELCNKLQVLKERGQADKMTHVQEMRELQRKLDHDAKLQQFLGIKGQRRVNTELEAREANKKKQIQEQLEQQLLEYEEILEKIKTFVGEKDVDKLASQFVKQEEENFALFNYVNELNHEVEQLNEYVQKLQDNIDEQKGLNESKEKFRMETIELLHKELSLQKNMASEANIVRQNCEEKLEELLFGVEKIFRLIKCDDTPILNLLGMHKRVTIHNVQLFLGIIERRSNQIISCINFVEQPSKILAKKDRVPKFNVRDSAKSKKRNL